MAFIRGANIVLDKLVLALDAGNDKSFRDEPTTNLFPDITGQTSRYNISQYLGKQDNDSGIFYYYTPTHGSYTLSADIKLYIDDAATNPRITIVVLYSDSTFDVVSYPEINDGISKRLSVTITTNLSKTLNYIYGWVADYSTNGGFRHFDVFNIQLEQKDHASTFVNGSRGVTVETGGGWKDLSGLENHGITYGNILSEIDISRCYNFSGATGAYSSESTEGFTFAQNMVQRTGDFTFNCWVKNPPLNHAQNGLFSNAGGGDGYRFGVGCDGIYFLIEPPYVEGTIVFSPPLSQTSWYNICTVFNRTSNYVDLYLNGEYVNGATIPSNQVEFQNAAPGIVKSGCCSIYQGKLAVFNVYNKALSPSEIKQNYNALKSRFNLE